MNARIPEDGPGNFDLLTGSLAPVPEPGLFSIVGVGLVLSV